jgi:hypothetical protein
MIFRPFKQLKQYQQLCELLRVQIEQWKTICARHEEIKSLNEKQIVFLTDLVKRQGEKLTQSQPVEVRMPLPDVNAVEGLVGAFFDAESVIIAREAIELTRNLAPLGPDDVMATQRCLLKLWRIAAMRKVEQAARP